MLQGKSIFGSWEKSPTAMLYACGVTDKPGQRRVPRRLVPRARGPEINTAVWKKGLSGTGQDLGKIYLASERRPRARGQAGKLRKCIMTSMLDMETV